MEKVLGYVGQLDMNAVREHYLRRERTHQELRELLEDDAVEEFAKLALGISETAGNYSAAEHRLGSRILSRSDAADVFDLAIEIDQCSSPHHLPKLIYDRSIPYLKISVGSEIAMMLRPSDCWVGNQKTIWSHLLVKHNGDRVRANDELRAYKEQGRERESEMDYAVWRDIYLALEQSMVVLDDTASKVTANQSVVPGSLRFMWPDAVAAFLYDKFASSRG